MSDDEASNEENIPNEKSLLCPDGVGQSPDRSSLDPASYQDPRAVPTRIRQLLLTSDFSIHGNDNEREPVVVQDEEKWLPSSQSLLLHRHHKLGHFFFYKLQIMASKGDIPREVIRCCIFLCSACLFGKATKRAWRTKGMINRIHGQIITKPGDCVLVDQLQSPILVFVRQMKGWLTQVRYDSATVLVDHYSGISYVHVQKSKNCEETILSKKTYETWCRTYVVNVRH